MNLQSFKEKQREGFTKKWGRFYYSDKIGIDWEKPKELHPDLSAGVLCIASDDMLRDLDSYADELLEFVEGNLCEAMRSPVCRQKVIDAVARIRGDEKCPSGYPNREGVWVKSLGDYHDPKCSVFDKGIFDENRACNCHPSEEKPN